MKSYFALLRISEFGIQISGFGNVNYSRNEVGAIWAIVDINLHTDIRTISSKDHFVDRRLFIYLFKKTLWEYLLDGILIFIDSSFTYFVACIVYSYFMVVW